MRRTPLRSKVKTPVRELDALCKEVVTLRDKGKCQRCGGPGTDWSHVHTRRLHSMRWRLDNSLLLCADCHRWWHREPMGAATWWSNAYPERMRSLTITHGTVVKPDLEAARKHLLAERKKYA